MPRVLLAALAACATALQPPARLLSRGAACRADYLDDLAPEDAPATDAPPVVNVDASPVVEAAPAEPAAARELTLSDSMLSEFSDRAARNMEARARVGTSSPARGAPPNGRRRARGRNAAFPET